MKKLEVIFALIIIILILMFTPLEQHARIEYTDIQEVYNMNIENEIIKQVCNKDDMYVLIVTKYNPFNYEVIYEIHDEMYCYDPISN